MGQSGKRRSTGVCAVSGAGYIASNGGSFAARIGTVELVGCDVGRDRLDDAVRLHRGRDLGRRRSQHPLKGIEVLDVGSDGDVVAAVMRDVVGHVGAGARLDGCSALRLAVPPTLDVYDR